MLVFNSHDIILLQVEKKQKIFLGNTLVEQTEVCRFSRIFFIELDENFTWKKKVRSGITTEKISYKRHRRLELMGENFVRPQPPVTDKFERAPFPEIFDYLPTGRLIQQ